MKVSAKIISTAVVASVAIAALGVFIGYKLGSATPPTVVERRIIVERPAIIERLNSREIISAPDSDVTSATMDLSSGSPHSDGYSIHAFVSVGIEMETFIGEITGQKSYRYHAYLLPDVNGFRMIIHHDSSIPRLTDSQYHKLMKRVEAALRKVVAEEKKSVK